MKESINARIRRHRKAAHLTQSELGEMIGVKTSTFSQMERKGQITCDMLLRLANALKIDATALLLGENTCDKKDDDIDNPILIPPVKTTVNVDLTVREYNIIHAFRNLSEQKKIWACENIFNLLLKRRKNPPEGRHFLRKLSPFFCCF